MNLVITTKVYRTPIETQLKRAQVSSVETGANGNKLCVDLGVAYVGFGRGQGDLVRSGLRFRIVIFEEIVIG